MITDVNVQALANYVIESEKLKRQVATLLAVIEQAEAAIEAFMNEDNWHGKGKVAPKWLLNQGAESLAAIKKVKESHSPSKTS